MLGMLEHHAAEKHERGRHDRSESEQLPDLVRHAQKVDQYTEQNQIHSDAG